MRDSLEDRIARLEAIEAIRALKARYLAACDAKDPEAVRACFADGPVHIDYGAIGTFDNADDLVKIYTDIACHPHMLEMHHGSNPRIELTDSHTAEGAWSMQYQLINSNDMTLTQIGGVYLDEYRLIEGEWKITSTHFSAESTLAVELGEAALKKMFAGRRMPMP